jgi:hypothetical protein
MKKLAIEEAGDPGLQVRLERSGLRVTPQKNEPEWLLEWRLKAYRAGSRASTRSIPSCCATYEKLGIPLHEQKRLARAWRSTRCSTASRWRPPSRTSWPKAGVIFCSISEAVREHPELVRKYLGSVVPHGQLLRGAELGGLQRRLVRLHPEGRALPDGAVDLLPHQRQATPASSSAR